MSFADHLQPFLIRYLERLRLRLAAQNAVLQLALLGGLSGVVAGIGMVAFRLVIEASPARLLGAPDPEGFEALSPTWRLLLPTLGGLLVGLLLTRFRNAAAVGVVHVMERLAYNEGQMPVRNAGIQFVGAALCILFGHSVGREGPAIHIGAASGSWMGQRLHLPNNSIRVLVGCGAAGAIAAAFNTPLAGVVFAMEVVLMEYTLTGFIPIILAAVAATTVSQAVFGAATVFVAPEVTLGSLADLGPIVVLGVVLGALASVFIRLLVAVTSHFQTGPLWLRTTLAGAGTGLLALGVPQIMGIGYDTVNAALLGQLGLGLMLAILAAKLAATVLGLGLGLPGGLIGPALVMGAMAGGALGLLINLMTPGSTSPAFYAMLGMGAMMGATLNAPLAALTALLELTANPHVILPGMLAVVAAGLTCQQGLKTPSVFARLMQARGLSYEHDPVSQFLHRLGVIGSMDVKIAQAHSRTLKRRQLLEIMAAPSTWLLVRDSQARAKVVFSAELLRYLETEPPADAADGDEPALDLHELPVHKLDAVPVSAQATLLGALRRMDKEGVDALYVIPAWGGRVLGVITRKDIERSYRYSSN